MTDPENQKTTTPPSPRRLLRSREDRMFLGVAGGLAEYLGIDPTLVRVGFVATALFGGLGIVAYLILALATPEDAGGGIPIVGQRPPTWLIVAAGLALIIVLPGPFWGAFDGHGWWWGWGAGWLLLIGAAALLAYIAFRDRNRRPRGPGGPPAAGRAEATPERGETPSPEQDEEAAGSEATTAVAQPQRPQGPHPIVRAIAIAVLAALALGAAGAIAVASAWTVATGNGAIAAAVVIALGVVLIASAFTDARRAAWLIVPALLIGLPAGALAASDIRFDGDVGEREYRPTTTTGIPEDGYRLGVGHLIVDLQGLPWRRGETVEVETDLGVGQTVVSVPPRVCVEVDATMAAGELYVRGARSAGVDPDLAEDPPPGGAPRLVLDSRVDVGQLTVSERPPEEIDHERFDGDRFDDDDEDTAAERLSARRACET
jgi:phage shock protein PspC (stress-responsive transcriptional regulator)